MYRVNTINKQCKGLLTKSKKYFVYQSILDGNTPGEIYFNDLLNPTSAVILDGGNFVLYLEGVGSKKDLFYIKNDILTDALREKYDEWILVVFGDQTWRSSFDQVFTSHEVHIGEKTLLRHELCEIHEFAIDKSIQVTPITNEILNSDMSHVKDLIEEVSSMWGSKEGFEKKGFGTCAIYEGQIIGWCTAEFVSERTCGIGIETIEAFQKKQVATKMTEAFLNLCKVKNIMPYWDSWTKNEPSVKTALKNSFEVLDRFNVTILKF